MSTVQDNGIVLTPKEETVVSLSVIAFADDEGYTVDQIFESMKESSSLSLRAVMGIIFSLERKEIVERVDANGQDVRYRLTALGRSLNLKEDSVYSESNILKIKHDGSNRDGKVKVTFPDGTKIFLPMNAYDGFTVTW